MNHAEAKKTQNILINRYRGKFWGECGKKIPLSKYHTNCELYALINIADLQTSESLLSWRELDGCNMFTEWGGTEIQELSENRNL